MKEKTKVEWYTDRLCKGMVTKNKNKTNEKSWPLLYSEE
jgi:hypothetical protein